VVATESGVVRRLTRATCPSRAAAVTEAYGFIGVVVLALAWFPISAFSD
jgi:hypothetical protein